MFKEILSLFLVGLLLNVVGITPVRRNSYSLKSSVVNSTLSVFGFARVNSIVGRLSFDNVGTSDLRCA